MRYKFNLLAFGMVLCLALPAMAQTSKTDTLKATSELDEVVVSGSKFSERSSKLAANIKVIKNADYKKYNLSNTANLLESTGSVFVQRSQQGGGSPVIRGFEASRILLMIDGVRMNNAIYRAGHLQNLITTDPLILDRIEVIYGPASTLYGSDALGGVVNLFTKSTLAGSAAKKDTLKLNRLFRYATANNEITGHVDFNYGSKKFGSLTSVNFSDFGDVTTGKNRDSKYPTFGFNKFIVNRIGNRDTAVLNPNPEKAVNSKYRQYDILQKFEFLPSENVSHGINLQFSNSSNIPRFDRLSEITSAGLPRFASWYYGPQTRFLSSYTFNRKNISGFFNEIRAIGSYQYIEESRFDRRFNQSVRNERTEMVNVSAITIDARHKAKNHEIVIGADAQLNFVRSVAQGFNVNNAAITKISTRYPDGKNRMHYAAVYGQHIWKINDKLTLNDGLRLNYTTLNSTFVDTAILRLPFTSASQTNLALSGNAGLVYVPTNQLKIAAVFSTGFRAPNFDDLAKVFDIKAGSVVVPNPDLGPEYTYNIELNTVKYFTLRNNPLAARISGSVFHTWFRDAIVTDKFRFNGQDSIIFNGVKSAVLASQNKARAYVWGYSLNGSIEVLKHVQANASVTYTYARYRNNNNVEVPLDHIPPVFGRAGIQYDHNKWYAEAYTIYNGWKRIKDYSPNGEDNAQYATADGMPSWYTLNARANYTIIKRLSIQLAVENIADKHYRTFASGISSPGRNFIMTLRAGL